MLLSFVVGNVYGFNYTHEKLLRLHKVFVSKQTGPDTFFEIL